MGILDEFINNTNMSEDLENTIENLIMKKNKLEDIVVTLNKKNNKLEYELSALQQKYDKLLEYSKLSDADIITALNGDKVLNNFSPLFSQLSSYI